MKDIRRTALSLGMFAVLTGMVTLPGCGNGYSKEPLLTIDSEEMQQRQREAEADKTSETTETENGERPVAEEEDVAETDQADTNASISDAEPLKTASAESVVPPRDDLQPAVFPGEVKDPQAQQEPREVKLLVPEKTFRAEGKAADRALRVSFDDLDLLKVLNMDPVTIDATEKMPDWLKELEGKRIRLRGFMFPPYTATEIPAFVLARDNQICCFGRNPKPYDVIKIVMREGVTTDYIEGRPFDVTGVFHIELLSYDDEKVDGLYYLDDALVIER
jgi:hypothetical protein